MEEKAMPMQQRSDETAKLLSKIKKCIENGKFRVSKHAIKRQHQRSISLQDALYVLSHGYHEEKMTLFDTTFQTWKYAIRGKTVDAIDVRVIIAFEDQMIIITVIRVTK